MIQYNVVLILGVKLSEVTLIVRSVIKEIGLYFNLISELILRL